MAGTRRREAGGRGQDASKGREPMLTLPLNKTTACFLPPASCFLLPASCFLPSGLSDSVEPQSKLVVECDDLSPTT
jgi:hypothetical protein